MALLKINWSPEPHEYKKMGFSLLASAVIFFILLSLVLKSTNNGFIAGITLFICSMIMILFPPKIARIIYLVIMGFSFVIGNITSRIFIALFFYFIITPIGLLLRFFRKDPLQINTVKDSYWIDSNFAIQKKGYEKQS